MFKDCKWQLARCSNTELERRWKCLDVLIDSLNLDALVVTSSTEQYGGYTRYLTGVAARNGISDVVIYSKGERMSVVRTGMAGGHVEVEDTMETLHRGVKTILTEPYRPAVGFSDVLMFNKVQTLLNSAGYNRLGFVGFGSMPHQICSGLNARCTDVTDLLEQIMSVKSEEEIAAIKATAAIQDSVMGELFQQIHPGMKEFEVAALGNYLCQKQGATEGHVLVGSGATGQPLALKEQRSFMTRTLGKNDHLFVLLEMNGPQGYYTELGRQAVFGTVPTAMKDELEFFNEARNKFIDSIGPNVDAVAECQAFSDHLESNGRNPQRRFFLHGQGYSMVERPHFIEGETMKIAANMSLACHPFSVNKGVAVGMSDNYLTGEGLGCERLHQMPTDITEIC